MTEVAGAQREMRPLPTLSALQTRVIVAVVGTLIALAGVGWFWTVHVAGDMASMSMGIGQAGLLMPADLSAPVFMLMWLAMMVAMMFPAIGPMVLVHRLVTRKRGESVRVSATFVAGYLIVWTAIGLIPLAAILALDNVSMHSVAPAWAVGASGAILIVAGLYQFSPVKNVCLRHCRSPLDFILTHDFGRGWRSALRAGVSHGAYCVGCCWALMAVLVVVGLMNLVWMAALALVFLAEKNLRGGVVVSRLAGVAVAGLGIAVLLVPRVLLTLSNTHAVTGLISHT